MFGHIISISCTGCHAVWGVFVFVSCLSRVCLGYSLASALCHEMFLTFIGTTVSMIVSIITVSVTPII